MPLPQAVNLRSLSGSARIAAEAEAARAVERGELVIAGSQTEYLGLRTLPTGTAWAADKLPDPAWLCPNVPTFERAFPGLRPIQKRVVHRLAPGPALFIVEVGEDDAAKVRGRAGLPERIVDDGVRFRVRILGPSVAASLVESSRGAVIGTPARGRDGRPCHALNDAVEGAESRGISLAAALDSGTVGAGAHPWPTEIRLDRRGGVHVEKEGAYERRFVLNQAVMNILFVCTGNTCRSPMAEAIARGLLTRTGRETSVHVHSAGLGAATGAPATGDAVKAVKSIGFTLDHHTSHPLTRRAIKEADIIFGMTRAHVAGILSLDPDAEGKVFVLDGGDGGGGDIADPIGLPAKVYTETAKRLERAIARRLKELAP